MIRECLRNLRSAHGDVYVNQHYCPVPRLIHVAARWFQGQGATMTERRPCTIVGRSRLFSGNHEPGTLFPLHLFHW
jgi:hypothetical protein